MIKFKNIFDYLVSTGTMDSISFQLICSALSFSTLISLYIFYIYRHAIQEEFYSKNFNISLALMSPITASIILAMQSNLVISLGMVGALSIVRYRTVIKSSLDLFFMFWSISIGIICGGGQYLLAIWSTVVVSVLLWFLLKLDFFDKKKMLIVHLKNSAYISNTQKSIEQNSSSSIIKSLQINNKTAEIIFEIQPKKNIHIEDILKNDPNVKDFSLILH